MPVVTESLNLGSVNILLQLPSTVLICQTPPAYKIMSYFFTRVRIVSNSNVKDTFDFDIVWVKWLFFFYLQPT